MTKTQHTPGPWAVSPYNNITSKNGTIAKTEQMPGNDETERKANARLIAAAPDLLSACKKLVDYLKSLPDDNEKCRHIKLALNNRSGDLILSAIAKAEGRAE